MCPRRFVVSHEATFEDFANLLRQMYGLQGPMIIRYVDDENEVREALHRCS